MYLLFAFWTTVTVMTNLLYVVNCCVVFVGYDVTLTIPIYCGTQSIYAGNTFYRAAFCNLEKIVWFVNICTAWKFAGVSRALLPKYVYFESHRQYLSLGTDLSLSMALILYRQRHMHMTWPHLVSGCQCIELTWVIWDVDMVISELTK